MRRTALACVSLLLVAAAADADWLEASSDHFVVYGDESEAQVRSFTHRLERYHAAMAHVFGKQQTRPSPSNRVTIFMVGSAAKVRKVIGSQNRYLQGRYIPRAGGSIAVVPRVGRTTREQTVLYHEYAHHFMWGLTARSYPRWFVEGFAEFFAGVGFREDGSVLLGTPAKDRGMELAYAPEVPIRRLLSFDGGAGDGDKPRRYDSFYGQAWVLFHYLQMAPERSGQLTQYQRLLAKGEPALEAAEAAFGDLDKLASDMDAYVMRRRLSAMVVDAAVLTTGPINVRKLREAEAAMMPIIIESKVGVDEKEAKELVVEARKVAAAYPQDPVVLSALAEAEFDAGNDDPAISAADRALAIDPNQINAHIQKGYALARKVESGALPKEAWQDARTQFAKANRVDNDNPIPLLHFYLTYKKQGEPPTPNSIEGLEWAMELAPFDLSLRWLVAQQMIADERYEEAARTLTPLAYSPHPGEHTDEARRLLMDIESRLQASREDQ